MRQVSAREQIGIRFDERAQHSFGNDFGAHRAMKKKIHVVLRPGRNLGLGDVGPDAGYRFAGVCAERDRQKKHRKEGASPANP